PLPAVSGQRSGGWRGVRPRPARPATVPAPAVRGNRGPLAPIPAAVLFLPARRRSVPAPAARGPAAGAPPHSRPAPRARPPARRPSPGQGCVLVGERARFLALSSQQESLSQVRAPRGQVGVSRADRLPPAADRADLVDAVAGLTARDPDHPGGELGRVEVDGV